MSNHAGSTRWWTLSWWVWRILTNLIDINDSSSLWPCLSRLNPHYMRLLLSLCLWHGWACLDHNRTVLSNSFTLNYSGRRRLAIYCFFSLPVGSLLCLLSYLSVLLRSLLKCLSSLQTLIFLIPFHQKYLHFFDRNRWWFSQFWCVILVVRVYIRSIRSLDSRRFLEITSFFELNDSPFLLFLPLLVVLKLLYLFMTSDILDKPISRSLIFF